VPETARTGPPESHYASLALLRIQAWALRSAGTHHGACLPACGARLRGRHLGSDVGERNLVPVSGHRLVKDDPHR